LQLRRVTWTTRYLEPREDSDVEEDYDNEAARHAKLHVQHEVAQGKGHNLEVDDVEGG
jgi:hypothetical protein